MANKVLEHDKTLAKLPVVYHNLNLNDTSGFPLSPVFTLS